MPWERQPSHTLELKVPLRLKLGCLGVQSWPGKSGDCGHDIPDKRMWASPGSRGTFSSPVARCLQALSGGVTFPAEVGDLATLFWRGGGENGGNSLPTGPESLGQLLITPVLHRFE